MTGHIAHHQNTVGLHYPARNLPGTTDTTLRLLAGAANAAVCLLTGATDTTFRLLTSTADAIATFCLTAGTTYTSTGLLACAADTAFCLITCAADSGCSTIRSYTGGMILFFRPKADWLVISDCA